MVSSDYIALCTTHSLAGVSQTFLQALDSSLEHSPSYVVFVCKNLGWVSKSLCLKPKSDFLQLFPERFPPQVFSGPVDGKAIHPAAEVRDLGLIPSVPLVLVSVNCFSCLPDNFRTVCVLSPQPSCCRFTWTSTELRVSCLHRFSSRNLLSPCRINSSHSRAFWWLSELRETLWVPEMELELSGLETIHAEPSHWPTKLIFNRLLFVFWFRGL